MALFTKKTDPRVIEACQKAENMMDNTIDLTWKIAEEDRVLLVQVKELLQEIIQGRHRGPGFFVRKEDRLFEVIPSSTIAEYCQRIERKNIRQKGESIPAKEMQVPEGIIRSVRDHEIVIQKNWREILRQRYEFETMSIHSVLVQK
jgi:hypothetical protein